MRRPHCSGPAARVGAGPRRGAARPAPPGRVGRACGRWPATWAAARPRSRRSSLPPRLPTWGVLELVVEAMDGDVGEFRTLWLAAGSVDDTRPGTAPGIAGRRDELRPATAPPGPEAHGLLLVSGEAGIGKTHLVRAADLGGRRRGVRGLAEPACRCPPQSPCSRSLDLLRAVYEVDDGQWLKEALTDCRAVRRGVPAPPAAGARAGHHGARRRTTRGHGTGCSLAVGATLAASCATAAGRRRGGPALGRRGHPRPPGAPADAGCARLPFVGHVADRGPGHRPGDGRSGTSGCRDCRDVPELELGPLEPGRRPRSSCALARGPDDRVRRPRSTAAAEGQPLFTEQLAAQPEGAPMPEPPGRPARPAARRMSAATPGRTRTRSGSPTVPLDDALLVRGPRGWTCAELAAGLHELLDRRLSARRPRHETVELRHPLLAEAIRRRLLAGSWPTSTVASRRPWPGPRTPSPPRWPSTGSGRGTPMRS